MWFIILELPLGLFIALDFFFLVKKVLDKAPLWILINVSLFCLLLCFYFFDYWSEIPFYFWIIIVIWIIFHIIVLNQGIEKFKDLR